VAAALRVAGLKQAVNRRRIVSGKCPHAIAGGATASVKSRRRRCTLSFMRSAWPRLIDQTATASAATR
jgi:hypothetical protein